jgi:hypothetical protein
MRSQIAIALVLLMPASAAAQVDLAGEWAPLYHEDRPERLPGPELGDYMGIPLSDAGRLAADSWDANRISVVTQYQCRPHSSDYGMRGLGNLRVWRDINPVSQAVTALHTYMPAWGSERTIWMDGRPHPPQEAEHTFQGFSTAAWDGNTLVITNGVPSSDKRRAFEYWTRHGEFLTVVTVVNDPVYLTQPLVRSQNWFLDPGQQLRAFPCEYVPEVVAEVPDTVPHNLPGTNRYLTEVADWYGLPLDATRGGAATMYPEYRLKMGPPHSTPPTACRRYCVCSETMGCNVNSPPPRR